MKRWVCLLLIAVTLVVFAIPISAASVPTYSISTPKDIAIDGRVTEKEWGKPIYKNVTLKEAEERKIDDQLDAWWFDTLQNKQASFDLYATNNNVGVGFACVVHNVPPETDMENRLWKLMNFTFTVSKWEDPGGVASVLQEDGRYEVYTGFRLCLMADGQMKQEVLTQSLKSYELFRGYDFQIEYDLNTHTITYEVLVPYRLTNIDPSKHDYIAFSAVIGLNFSGNSVNGLKNGSNRFVIGRAAATCGKVNNFAHKDQCIKIKLAPYEQVSKLEAEKLASDSIASGGTHITSDSVNAPKDNDMGNESTNVGYWIILIVSVVMILLCVGYFIWMLIRARNKKKEAGSQ